MSINRETIPDIAVICIYLLIMAGVGLAYRRSSKDISDYFRAGASGTWWLVGTSVFMGGFTAITFTGIAGQAFVAGWSVLTIFWAGVVSAMIQGIFFAPWFRQIRAITGLDVNYDRFGRTIEQAYGYFGIATGSIWSAVQLYGLSIFVSAIFGIQVHLVIIVVGSIIAFYSVSGGRWAVLATDFLQALILMPITILVAFLSLQMVGGIGGLFTAIDAQGLGADFSIVKPADWNPSLPGAVIVIGSFTLGWTLVQYVGSTVDAANLQQSYKFFAVKDGPEARKAAILAGVLRLFGSLVFFIPPIVARLMIPDQVMSMTNVGNPVDASYAVISMHLLPAGMMGLVVVAMFTATMSTMDTGLTANAGNITKNLYPVLMKAVGVKAREGKELLQLARYINLSLGLLTILIALQMSVAGSKSGLFGILLDLGALLGLPLTLPFFWGLLIRKAPEWSALSSIAMAAAMSLVLFFDDTLLGMDISWQMKWILVFTCGSVGFLVSLPFWNRAPQAYREKVDSFFETMHRPVDFAKEIGAGSDAQQLSTIGSFGIGIAFFILLLLLVPGNENSGKSIIGTASAILLFSALMLGVGRYLGKKG